MSRPDQGGTVAGTASYRAVLALPRARGLFAAAILPRLNYGLLGLPLVLTLRAGTGSYALAGVAASLFGLGVALLGPARARLVQRHRGALVLLAAAYALSLVALAIASAATRLPAVVPVGLACLAGLCPPPVGPLTRTLWGQLAPDEAHLQRALSLDTAAESAVFGAGPALAGGLIALAGAPLALGACAALAFVGCALLARTARAIPQGEPGPVRAAPTAGRPRRFRGLPPLLLLTWAIAAAVGAAEIAVIAAWGPLTAGLLMALFPIGGVLGGLAYGSRDWKWRLSSRPLALAALTVACYAIPVLVFLPATMAVALLLAGACADILVVTTYQWVNARIQPDARTEASAWLNTAYNLGSAAGTAASGVLVSHAGPRVELAIIAALTALCATLTIRTGPRRSQRGGVTVRC